MKTLNLTQGTKSWLDTRLQNFTASEAAAALGVSKYMSRTELLDLKKSGVAKPVNEFTQKLFDKGHAVEELARPIAEKIIGEDLYPVTGLLENTNLLASYDGLTMMEDVVWENKLLNKSLKESLSKGVIPEQYKPQLQQQLMVCKAERALFMASDGTEENTFYAWYESNEELANKIVSTWKQFAIDLENHVVTAKEEKVVAQELQALPKLEISLVGNVSNSNLIEYKTTALAFIQSISTDLQSDQDFVDADKAVKFFTSGEKELEAVKERALSDTADIKTLFDTIDELKEEMRQKRLKLTKLVKTRKDEIRSEISMKAQVEFSELLIATSKNLNGIQITQVTANFDSVMKGKKTVESLQNAVDSEMARVKIELSEISELVRTNLNSLTELAGEFKFLFSDYAQLIFKENDDLTNLIKSRIAEHKEAEAKQKAAEQERIEIAAKEKAEREAQAKLDAEREQIRLDAEAKAKAKFEAEQEQESYSMADVILAEEAVQEVVNKQEPIAQPEAARLARQIPQGNVAAVLAETEYRTSYGDYEPLPSQYWPSHEDCMENETISMLTQKLEEAQAYIQMLLADKAA